MKKILILIIILLLPTYSYAQEPDFLIVGSKQKLPTTTKSPVYFYQIYRTESGQYLYKIYDLNLMSPEQQRLLLNQQAQPQTRLQYQFTQPPVCSPSG